MLGLRVEEQCLLGLALEIKRLVQVDWAFWELVWRGGEGVGPFMKGMVREVFGR